MAVGILQRATTTALLTDLTQIDGAGSGLDADLLDGISSGAFALGATTITAAGLVTGGGDLSANRTVTVTAASAAQAKAQSSSAVAVTPANLADFAAVAFHPGYVAGRWYMPFNRSVQAAVGGAIAANSIRLAPFFIPKAVTISTLGARITTAAASGNIQLAIYNSSTTTGLPTTLAAHTASISTTSTGLVSAAVVEGSGSVTLAPGLYWMAINADATAGGTVIMQAYNTNGIFGSDIIGSATQANVSTGTNLASCIQTVAATFDTWTADLTGTTADNLTAQYAAIHFLAA